jgi:surface polysaccharide O-acyltransferase-like enzyme
MLTTKEQQDKYVLSHYRYLYVYLVTYVCVCVLRLFKSLNDNAIADKIHSTS